MPEIFNKKFSHQKVNKKHDKAPYYSPNNEKRKCLSKNKIIFDKKMTRKERKQELIKRSAEIREARKNVTKKQNNKIETNELECIFIIKHGKVSKAFKNLITGLKLIFQPHSNIKFEDTNVFDVEIYKKMIKIYNIRAFFILKETPNHNMLKIYNVKDKTSDIFKIIDFDTNFVNKKFDTPALITYSGFSRVQNPFLELLGKSTFDDTKNIKRVLNLNYKNQEISLRHFEITIQETRCTKIGLKELGPKLDLVFIKRIEGGLDDRW